MKQSFLPLQPPTIFIVFGVTGDLLARKIAPALFHLFKRGALPSRFHVVGVSRRDWSDGDLRSHLDSLLSQHSRLGHLSRLSGRKEKTSFFSLWSYHTTRFDVRKDYDGLARLLKEIDDRWGMCSNKLFHLAVPPNHYEEILSHLSASGLTDSCGEGSSLAGGGWTRVIVEKPFGKNLEHAEALDMLLGNLFKEKQIYRIDHYLAKEMLQNILAFRFSNSLFEGVWNNQYIESITIRALESLDVGSRGAYYDGIGALRDMGQNHLLQFLALLTLDRPKDYTDDSVRKRRAEILSALVPMNQKTVRTATVRAQYAGYRDSPGVSAESETETYFRISPEFSSARWKGVRIVLESGKATDASLKEAVVEFKHPAPCLCPANCEHTKNKIIFRIEPEEEIVIHVWAKIPGLAFEMEERTIRLPYREKRKKSQYVEEYEKLLLDCIGGDQTLFVSTDEVRAMWKFVDPIIREWTKGEPELLSYEKGSLPFSDD